MQYTLSGQYIQPTKQSKLWMKRKTAKQKNSKNKSKDEENIYMFQNKIGDKNMDKNTFINKKGRRPSSKNL